MMLFHFSLTMLTISNIIDEVTPTVEKNFADDSPQRIFWEQQQA